MASAKWNSLPKPVQEDWIRKAITIKKDPGNIDAATKAKLIDQHIKLVAKEVSMIITLKEQCANFTLQTKRITNCTV